MSKISVPCPECGASVSVTDAIAAQADAEHKEHMKEAIRKAEAKARAETLEAGKLEVQDLKAQISEQKKAADRLRSQELELRSEKRRLEEKVKAVDLEIQRGVDAEKAKMEASLKASFEQDARIKDTQYKIHIESMTKQIEELKRKSEQGSQQLQGEALEISLEEALGERFPYDTIEPVAKGVKGGDIIQRVVAPSGKTVGTILWEAKRTKSWSDGWIEKIKDHQREIGAEHAVIITQTMPKGASREVMIDGVWVVDFKTYLVLASALHFQVISVAQTRNAAAGKGDKMEVLYDYFTGTAFKQRVEAMIEIFLGSKDDLDRERRAITKIWSARERQHERFVLTIAGLHGDIQGIVGRALPSIAMLELEAGNKDGEPEDAGT